MPGNPHPKTDHLVATRFKKGMKRLPGAGRPRRPQTEANRNMLEQRAPREVVKRLKSLGLRSGATFADVNAFMLEMLVLQGKAHSIQAAKELRESVEGKSTQRIELLAHEDRRIRVEVAFDEPPGLPQVETRTDDPPATIDVPAKLVENAEEQKSADDTENT